MGIPVLEGFGSTFATSSATSRVIGMPGTRNNGDRLIAWCVTKNAETHTWSGTGWTKRGQQNSGSFTVSVAECIVNGSEANPTCSWSSAANVLGKIARFSGTDSADLLFDGADGVNTGTGTTHSCTGISTTRGNSLVIYLAMANASGGLDTPSGWTEGSDVALVSINSAIGSKGIASSGSGSGDISVTGPDAEWVMWQIELRSPASGNRRRRALLTGAA